MRRKCMKPLKEAIFHNPFDRARYTYYVERQIELSVWLYHTIVEYDTQCRTVLLNLSGSIIETLDNI